MIEPMLRASGAHRDAVCAAVAAIACPFAHRVDIDVWQLGRSVTDASEVPGSFLRALQRAAVDGDTVRGLVVHLASALSPSPAALEATTLQLLGAVRAANGDDAAAPLFLDAERWWYPTGGTRWFVTVHSDLFSAKHSRYWPLAGSLVTMLPEWVFARLLENDNLDLVRARVRDSFAAHGQRYPLVGGAFASVDQEGPAQTSGGRTVESM